MHLLFLGVAPREVCSAFKFYYRPFAVRESPRLVISWSRGTPGFIPLSLSGQLGGIELKISVYFCCEESLLLFVFNYVFYFIFRVKSNGVPIDVFGGEV